MEKFKQMNSDGQFNINFDEIPASVSDNKNATPEVDTKTEIEEAYKKEQIEVAIKYKIVNPKELIKKEDGNWYFHDMEIKEYDDLHNGNDNTTQYEKDRDRAAQIKGVRNEIKRLGIKGYNPYQ